MAAELTASNAAYLRGRTGKEPGAGGLPTGTGGRVEFFDLRVDRFRHVGIRLPPGLSDLEHFPSSQVVPVLA